MMSESVLQCQMGPTDSLPGELDLSSEMQEQLAEASSLLLDIGPLNVRLWRDLATSEPSQGSEEVQQIVRTLRDDPLSNVYLEYHGTDAQFQFSKDDEFERSGGGQHQFDLSNGVLSERNFISFIQNLSSLVLERDSKLRADRVFTSPDRYRRYMEFAPVETIRPQLNMLIDVLRDASTTPVYRATVAYVSIVNIHPFVDGNGRVARLFFNTILKAGGLRMDGYVPVKELIAISQGIFIMHTRRAWKLGDWSGIFADMCAAVRLSYLFGK